MEAADPLERAVDRSEAWPSNPVLCRVWRDGAVESQHRGAWVLVDAAGRVLDGAGDADHPIFARSSTKALQVLPLIESGAAQRFGVTDEELALCVASHSAEPCHTEVVARFLDRLGLGPDALRCGAHPPTDSEARAALRRAGERPSALHNNCSGKHAGFLALALHVGDDPARYLDPECASQRLVRDAVAELCAVAPAELEVAVDGCSAPTFRLPLRSLATGMARLADPAGLGAERRAACERVLRVAGAHPELVAGTRDRLDTDILRASAGRVYAKIGAEAVYVLADAGAGRAVALKVDDGSPRGFQALVVDLLRRFDLVDADGLRALERWREATLRNWAGRDVGRLEVVA